MTDCLTCGASVPMHQMRTHLYTCDRLYYITYICMPLLQSSTICFRSSSDSAAPFTGLDSVVGQELSTPVRQDTERSRVV